MKSEKRYPHLVVILLILWLAGGCSAESGNPDPADVSGAVTGITNTMDDPVISVAVGRDCQLEYLIEPSDATNQSVDWSTGEAGIVTVNATGLITGVAVGTATVSATTADGGFQAEYSISVTEYIPVTGISLSRTSITASLSSYEVLKVAFIPEDATDKSFTIGSSNTGVVSVYGEDEEQDLSVLLTQGGGSADITVSAEGGTVSAQCSFTVVPVHVYTGGSISLSIGPDILDIPVIWRDKPIIETSLASGSYGGYVTDITARNGVIYAAGSQYNLYAKDNPIYWIDGTPTVLDAETAGHSVTDIFCYDGTVYAAGSYTNKDSGTWVYTACYWTGSTRTSLPDDGLHGSRATGIMVVDGVVYTSGYYNDGTKNIACYWTGTTRTDLPGDGTHTALTSGIHVAGGIVYTGGSFNKGTLNTACYWTGTTLTELPGLTGNRSIVSDITVSGSTVYTSGSYSDELFSTHPCYWTDSTRTDLEGVASGDLGCANSIAIKNGMVFTCGTYDNGKPCYWIGTKQVKLLQTDSASTAPIPYYAVANAIEVTD